MQFITILGRQPAISIAELERVFGSDNVSVVSKVAAKVQTNSLDIQRIGGSLKAGIITGEVSTTNWEKIGKQIVNSLIENSPNQGKVTLGISVYGLDVTAREVQKVGLIAKSNLKKSGISIRLIPNMEPALNTATSHHNKLGLSENKVEMLVIKTDDSKTIIAKSVGAQNITALANRDQKRPKRDAHVGMLPPKLAQIMVNLAVGQSTKGILLDPFCGTGVILQEAALLGFDVIGTDLSEKMVEYSKENLEWLLERMNKPVKWKVEQGDAMIKKWGSEIDYVATETYLGQPFSTPPSPEKLDEVKRNCNHIISDFLNNLAGQVKSGTSLCIAVPAWRDSKGNITHLPLISKIEDFGYKKVDFKNVFSKDLTYYREDQVVARELLLLTRK